MDEFNHMMTADNIAEIMHRNFKFDLVEDEDFLGRMIRLSPHEAFTLSLIQGAPYLITQMGYSLKGRLEVLIHRGVFQNNKYIYSPGLFGRRLDFAICEGESPYYIRRKYPRIFKGDKFVIFREIRRGASSNIERNVYDTLRSKGLDPSDYMLFKVHQQSSNLEPFFEYLCCKLFGNMGYLTEDQIPWFQQSFEGRTGGIPDFSACKIPLINELGRRKLLPRGEVIQELSTILMWRDQEKEPPTGEEYELLLGEVKASKSQWKEMLRQLERYASVRLCDKEYAVLHDETDLLKDHFGLIHIDDEYRLSKKESRVPLKANLEMQKSDQIWLTNYAKFYLLGNLPINEVTEFINNRRQTLGRGLKVNYRSFDLIESVVTCPTNDLLDFVAERLEKVMEAE